MHAIEAVRTSRPLLIAACSAWKCAGSWPGGSPVAAGWMVLGKAPQGDTAVLGAKRLVDVCAEAPNRLVEDAAPKSPAEDAGAPNSPPEAVAAPNMEAEDAPSSVPPGAGVPKRPPPEAAGVPNRPPPDEAAGVPNKLADEAAGVPNKPPDDAGALKRPPEEAGVVNKVADAARPAKRPPACDVPARRGDWPAAGRAPASLLRMNDRSWMLLHIYMKGCKRIRENSTPCHAQPKSAPAEDAPKSEPPELGAPNRLPED